MNRSTSFDPDPREDRERPAPERPCSLSDEDDREFIRAMDEYKQQSGRSFPTWSEILEVLRGLGYAKRIWRPVEEEAPAWSTVDAPERPGDGPGRGVRGWFARVETPVDS